MRQRTNKRMAETVARRRSPVRPTALRVPGLVLSLAIVTTLLVTACSRDTIATPDVALTTCRLKGIETAMRCGTLTVAEDRDAATGSGGSGGRTIAIGFAVMPALARKAESAAVFVFAGGPGQAATDIAGRVLPLFARLNRDRDIVFVDQRGTGRSHKLDCRAETGSQTGATGMADAFDDSTVAARVAQCAARLSIDADLTRYTTRIAMKDIDDVRARLGYPRIDVWGASYGTRAALEYLRQFPTRVRTMTLDGVAPSSQKLPLSFGVDTDAAVVDLVAACAQDTVCHAHYPKLGTDIDKLFARLGRAPIETDVTDPVTGVRQHVVVTLSGMASLLRTPLYTSLTASLLPAALDHAAHGDFDALAALTFTVAGGVEDGIALGMHLSVVCAEDVASITDAELAAMRVEATHSVVDGKPNPFASLFVDQYRRMCAHWPVARRPDPVEVVHSDVPMLLLSGGIDPATPPRYADTVARTLTHARNVVAPQIGHGVSLQGCAPDLIERFVRSADPLSVDGGCLRNIPRPAFFTALVDGPRAAPVPAVP